MENYFPKQDSVLVVENRGRTNDSMPYAEKFTYSFIPFHPVAVTSEMVGTSIEELYMHNFATARNWESGRMIDFPQEVVLRTDFRAYFKYILLKAKANRPIEEVEIWISDGIFGQFHEVEYRKIGKAKNIDEDGQTIKVDGIGNFLKLIFTAKPKKTKEKS